MYAPGGVLPDRGGARVRERTRRPLVLRRALVPGPSHPEGNPGAN